MDNKINNLDQTDNAIYFRMSTWQLYKYEYNIVDEEYLGQDSSGLDVFKWNGNYYHVGEISYTENQTKKENNKDDRYYKVK